MGAHLVRKCFRPAAWLLAFIVILSAIEGRVALASDAQRVVMPFACALQDGKLRVLPSPPRTYDIVSVGTERRFTVCDPGSNHNCRVIVAGKFDVACENGHAPWFKIAQHAAGLLGGGAMVRNGKLRLQFRGVQEPWSAPTCQPGSWPPNSDKLGRIDPALPARGCATMGAFNLKKPYLTFPNGYAPVDALGARMLGSASVLNTAAPVATASLPASAPTRPWLTVVAVAAPPRPAPESDAGWLSGLLIGVTLAILAMAAAGAALWLRANRPTPPPFRPREAFDAFMRRAGARVIASNAQSCATLCQTAQDLIDEVHDKLAALSGAAPLKRTLMGELRSIEQFLSAQIDQLDRDESDLRRTRSKVQRAISDTMRLREIVDSAQRSLVESNLTGRGLPRDRDEALEVLGANPDASERILKRLVDALRATWHPDHASDDADRERREERIKQINVAWDLICGKRAEA